MRPKLHFIFAAVCAVLILGSCWDEALASPPANDNFANAQNLNINQNTLTANNTEATKETGEPAHGWNRGGRSIWYKYVAAANGVLTVTSLGIDSLMGVYQGNNVGSLVFVGGNDDIVTNNGILTGSEVVFGVQTGITYYIAVDGRVNSNGNISTGSITLTYKYTAAPTNDTWSASTIGFGANGAFNHYSTTNQNAGKEAGEPNHAGNSGGRSVWFKIGGPVGSHSFTLTVQGTQPSNATVEIATLVSVYQGNSLATLTPVTSTVSSAHHPARVTFVVPGSTEYYVAIDGFNSGSGAAIGNFSITCTGTETRRHPEFDGDGKTEISVFRPSTGVWYTRESVTGDYHAFV